MKGLLLVKRLGGLLLLLTLLIQVSMATTATISPTMIDPGDIVTVDVKGLLDGTTFSLDIKGEFDVKPGGKFDFTIRDLVLPFSLDSGEVSAYTRGTSGTEFSMKRGGCEYILDSSVDENGDYRITESYDITSGTYEFITLGGRAASETGCIIAEMAMTGRKNGSDDDPICFTIEGIEQGTVTVTIYVDGREILSSAIPVGDSPTLLLASTSTIPMTPIIESNRETVTRRSNFTVTVTGEAKKDYRLYVMDIGGVVPEAFPVVAPDQSGITSTSSPTDVIITTNDAGTRSIQFSTNPSTGEWRFPIRVEDLVPRQLSKVG